jgi:hypothetical protein
LLWYVDSVLPIIPFPSIPGYLPVETSKKLCLWEWGTNVSEQGVESMPGGYTGSWSNVCREEDSGLVDKKGLFPAWAPNAKTMAV